MMVDRQEFFELISEAVAAPARDGLTGGRLPPGRAETRVLEAHAPEPSPEGVAALVGAVSDRSGLHAERVGDELWWITGDAVVGFLDTMNPRFWQLHSTSPANEVARVARAIVAGDPRLDTAWLPKSLLQDLEGEHLWVKSAFEADELLGAEVSARRWRARFEGDAPEGLLELLRNTEYRAGRHTHGPGLTSSRTAYRRGDRRGRLPGRLCDRPGRLLRCSERHLEHGASIRALGAGARRSTPAVRASTRGRRVVVEGDVATIMFGREVEDLDRLVAGLFAAKEPFGFGACRAVFPEAGSRMPLISTWGIRYGWRYSAIG